MTKDNIILALIDILKKDNPTKVLISNLIDNGLMESDFYKMGFSDNDIDDGVSYNFTSIDNLQVKALALVNQFFNETDDDYGYIINSNKASLTMDLIAYLEYNLNKKGKGK